MKKIILSLRYGMLSRIWPAAASLLVRLLGPRFAAYMTYLGMDWGTYKNGPTVLCISRESFIKDIRELRTRGHMNYPMLMGGFTRFQMCWFPQEMQIQTFYQSYNGPGKEQAIQKSTEYARHLMKLVSKKQPVHAVLSANFDYWQDVGFKNVCHELGIPFIVLSREHPVIPKICTVVIDWYQRSGYHFDGAAITVAGKSTKDVLSQCPTVCPDEHIHITGLPRYDAWLDVNTCRPMAQRKWVTLLTFTEGYYADDTFAEVLRAFCHAAKDNAGKGVSFLVKTKDMDDTRAVRNLVGDDLSYVTCTHELDLFQVLPESRLVINYNSLSLVEAAMAHAPIVVPAWGQCIDQGGEAMYSSDNTTVHSLIRYAYSADELVQVITDHASGNAQILDTALARAFVNEFIHIPASDTCTDNFERVVQQVL